MKKALMKMAVTAAVLFPTGAIAQATCPVDTVDGIQQMTVDGYFEEKRLAPAFPSIVEVTQRIERLAEDGCKDQSFISGVLDGLAAYEPYDRALQGTLGQVERGVIENAVELLLLGRPEPIQQLIAKIEDFEAEGRLWATLALGILGTDTTLGLSAQVSRVRGYASAYLSDVDVTVLPQPMLSEQAALQAVKGLQDRLTAASTDRVAQAIDQGYPLATVYQAFGTPDAFDPCGDIKNPLSKDRLTPQVIVDVSNWLWAMDSKLTERATGVIVENMALAMANIHSNCRYSTTGRTIDFGLEDEELARKFMHIAVRSPDGLGVNLSPRTFLALATDIESTDLAQRHTPAARALIQYAGGRYSSDFPETFYSDIVPRFSRETIREAQRLLSKYDLYTSGLDGIPGKGFKRGFDTINYNVLCGGEAFKQFSEMCVGSKASEVRDLDWLAPYLLQAEDGPSKETPDAEAEKATLADYPGPVLPFHFEAFYKARDKKLVSFGTEMAPPSGFELSASLSCEDAPLGSLFLAQTHSFLMARDCAEIVFPALEALDATPTLGLPGQPALDPLDQIAGDVVMFYRDDMYTPDWRGTISSIGVGAEFTPKEVQDEFGIVDFLVISCFDWELVVNGTLTKDDVFVTTKGCFRQIEQDVQATIGAGLVLGLPSI